MIDNERIFIVGDIHGCLDMLKRLMERIDWDPEDDALIFLGDYIDRGKDSKGVVDYIMSILKSSPNVHCLMGNHEKIFIDFLSGGDLSNFFLNGGDKTLSSYGVENEWNMDALIPAEHLSFLHSLLFWVELKDYFVVHAGFRPGVPIKDQTLVDLIWIRDPFLLSKYNFGKKVIFGHTPFPEPLVMDNKIGLDTGAVYGNKLTCLELPAFKFHSVTA
jgi:diadenosine tetraphosphatase ApaH/serine/threonine PP2A family protein phosphatase